MWDGLVRWARVEVALWRCYWRAPEDDEESRSYCFEHSALVCGFWATVVIVILLGLFVLVRSFAFPLLCR